jgi:hypothetical protein
MKIQATEWETIFTSYLTDKGLIFRIYKAQKTKQQKNNNPVNKGANELNRQFSEEIQMANNYMKQDSIC